MKKQFLEFLHTCLSDEEVRFLTKGWMAVRALGTVVFVVCFVSCENEIAYKESTGTQQLVISADMATGSFPSCFVCATTPTLGTVPQDTVWEEEINSQGDTVRYSTTVRQRAFLSDAAVRMCFNDGDWIPAQYDSRNQCYTIPTHIVSEGDRIGLEVEHTALGKATAVQTVPPAPAIRAIHTTDLYPEITPNGWVQFTIDFVDYAGDTDDIIGIRLRQGAFACRTTREVSYEREESDAQSGTYTRIVYDTVTTSDTIPLTFLYGEGEVWNMALNHRSRGCKYYGAMTPCYLYLTATQLRQNSRIALFADQDRDYRVLRQDSLCLLHLSLEVAAFSRDYYRYRATAGDAWSEYNHGAAKFPTGVEYDERYDYTSNDFEDIISEIGSLGHQEGIQIYSNIEGGIGHFSTYTAIQVIVK